VDYVPSRNLVTTDTVRFTYRDRSSPPQYASTPALTFRFRLVAVDDSPVVLPLSILVNDTDAREGRSVVGRLRYYDVETPHSNLNVSMSLALGFYDPLLPRNATNASVFFTDAGMVELLPASTRNETDGTGQAVMFRYTPNGKTYVPFDKFTFIVSDGHSMSLGNVTILSALSSSGSDSAIGKAGADA
jgi:hypothetical protein